jgi:hypothetical protein
MILSHQAISLAFFFWVQNFAKLDLHGFTLTLT